MYLPTIYSQIPHFKDSRWIIGWTTSYRLNSERNKGLHQRQVLANIVCDIAVSAGTFWGRKGYFAETSPDLPEKVLCNKHSPYKFRVTLGTLYFPLPVLAKIENRTFGTWNLVLDNPTDKRTQGLIKNIVLDPYHTYESNTIWILWKQVQPTQVQTGNYCVYHTQENYDIQFRKLKISV